MCSCIHKWLITQAVVSLQLAEFEYEAVTTHDADCAFRTGQCCNCSPRLSLKTKAGDVLVDEDGEVRVMCVN